MNQELDPLIRLRLTATGMDGLFELLPQLAGIVLGDRFVLRELYAVGGQSILWITDDLTQANQPVITRIALLPYHRPAYIQTADIERARARIEREADLLKQFQNTVLPRLYGLFYAPNPLYAPERAPEITHREPFLVMEYIPGINLADWTRQATATWQMTNALAEKVARVFCQLCLELHKEHFLYTDLNPHNVMIAQPNAPLIRLVDAGSIIPDIPGSIQVPFSWDFIPPEYYETYQQGKTLWPNERFVLYTLGKTLWSLVTHRQPIPGDHPDLRDPSLRLYPQPIVELIAGLIHGRYSDFETLNNTLGHDEVIKK